MADTTQTENPDARFKSVLIYVNWTTGAILLIVIAVFFIPIPINNQKYVDIGLGILLGILSSNAGTITGSPTTPVKKPDVTTPVVGDNATVNNNPPPADPVA